MFAPLVGLRRCRWPLVVFWSATAWAQNTPWPEANQNATQHPRGHIDILRWEQTQDRLRPTRPPVAAYCQAAATSPGAVTRDCPLPEDDMTGLIKHG